MPSKEPKTKTEISNIKSPTPPIDPVHLSRWVQVTHNDPKPPKKQPDDPAMLPTPLKKPATNRVIGTDKPKREKPKRANTANTRTPSYLATPKPVPVSQVKNIGAGGSLVKFLQWFNDNGADIDLRKMIPSTLAAFGLGWYVSDILTRDEKQKWQRQLDDEFKRSIERQDEANRMSRTGRRLKKSAYDELQGYYQGLMG